MDFRDAAGDRTTITWPDTGSNALAATYAYDVLQRVTSISVGGSTIASYGYDQYGRRSTVARNGGTGAGTTYGYDGADRINSLAQSLTGSGAVTWTMAYDPSSAIVSREASNTSYLWHGGAVSTAYAANGLNQYTTAGGAPLSYSDGRANLTSLSSTGPTFSFDTANDLLSASGPTAVTLTYDPVGRIQTKTSGGATETFLYAGSMLVGEYNSAGAILDRYVPGPGQDEAALWYSGAGTVTPQWLHADQQGSTIAWSNGSGASLGTQAYDPYGQPSVWSGPRYAYTGQLMIAEAQLYHYKARAYDPAIGRFLQTDAAGQASDINPYAYAGGDPVNGVDPSGMDAITDPLIKPIDGTEVAGVTVTAQSLPPAQPPVQVQNQAAPTSPTTMWGGVSGLSSSSGSGDTKFTTVGELVITARKTKSLAGVQIKFNLPFPLEQLWVVGPNGVTSVPTHATMGTCKNGAQFGSDTPSDPNFSIAGAWAVIHTHPDWALPFPGPEDGAIPSAFGIPNYGISPYGAWVVTPGPPLDVQLISGSWGTGPNGETFDPQAYASRINTPGTGGKVPGC